MSLNCPKCGTELSLNLAQVVPQISPLVPHFEPQVEPQSRVGGVRSSARRVKYQYEDAQFNTFWEVYPRRVGKASAFSKWLIVVREVEPQIVIEAAAQYAKEVEGLEPQYVKYPEGWLTAGRWDDEPVTALTVVTPRDQIVGTPEWQAANDAEYERLRAEGDE